MDIEPVLNEIGTFATHAFEACKAGTVWCGHAVKTGYSRYAIPAGEKLSALAIYSFDLMKNLLQTGPGPIFAIAGCILFIGMAAFKMADRKAYEEDMFSKTAWKTAGIVAFISATALTSLGMFTVLAI